MIISGEIAEVAIPAAGKPPNAAEIAFMAPSIFRLYSPPVCHLSASLLAVIRFWFAVFNAVSFSLLGLALYARSATSWAACASRCFATASSPNLFAIAFPAALAVWTNPFVASTCTLSSFCKVFLSKRFSNLPLWLSALSVLISVLIAARVSVMDFPVRACCAFSLRISIFLSIDTAFYCARLAIGTFTIHQCWL